MLSCTIFPVSAVVANNDIMLPYILYEAKMCVRVVVVVRAGWGCLVII